MNIEGVSAVSGVQSTQIAAWQQRQQTFKGMLTAIQSGDLATAQADYAKLIGSNGSASGSSSLSPNSPLGQIGQALQSGDIAGAQKVVASMKQNANSATAQSPAAAVHGHHGHHHHGGEQLLSSAKATASSNQSTSGSTSSLNLLA